MESNSVSLALGGANAVGWSMFRSEDELKRCSGRVTLHDVLTSKLLPEDELIPVLAVHVRRVTVASQQQSKRFRICVKSGEAGASVRCETKSFIPSAQVAAGASGQSKESSTVELDSSCLFLQDGAQPTMIRLRLCRAGVHLGRQVVATAAFHASPLGLDMELPLLSRGTREVEVVGHISVAVQFLQVARADLASSLAVAQAKPREHGYLIPGVLNEALDKASEGSCSSDGSCDSDGSQPPISCSAEKASTKRSADDRFERVLQMAAICGVPSLM